jgi:hypothetical protein
MNTRDNVVVKSTAMESFRYGMDGLLTLKS